MTDETYSGKANPNKITQKYIALLFWLAILVAYQWYARSNQLSALDVIRQMELFPS